MSILSWVSGKVTNKLMDEADKELVLLRGAMGSDMQKWEHFFETMSSVRESVPQLAGMWRGPQGAWAEHGTGLIQAIPEAHRNALAQRLLEIAAKHNRTDPVGSAAIKMLATWIKLIDIRADQDGSMQSTLRANNLIALYEATLNSVISRMQ